MKTYLWALCAMAMLLPVGGQAQPRHVAEGGTWVDTMPEGAPTRVQWPQSRSSVVHKKQSGVSSPLGLVVKKAWIDPAPQGGRTYVHFTVENTTDRDVMLTGISSPLAQRTVVQLMLKNSVGQFSTADALPVPLPAGEEKVFSPTTLAVDMVGLTAPMEVGSEFPLTLTLENGDNQTYRIPVGLDFQR
jgi:copper(I)-binding protein